MSENPDPVLAALARLEAGQEALADRLDRMQQRQGTDLAAHRTDLMARLDRLQDSITAIRDDITVNMGAADNAKEAALSTRRELRGLSEMTSAMRRQIERLQTQMRELRGEP